jgi:adenylate cyclase
MIPRPATLGSNLKSKFDQEFALEVLQSDKLRVTILIGVLGSVLLLVTLLMTFATEQFNRAFYGRLGLFIGAIAAISGSAILCLLIERTVIGRLIERRKSLPVILQYLSAVLETSLPTAGMIIGSFFLGPIYTLFTPAAFLYPVFIVLSALRLDIRLCIFTGFVAGTEYTLIALYFLSLAPNESVEPILVGLPHHVFKGFLLIVLGVVTGLVTRQIKRRILRSFEMVEERNRISRTFGEYVSPVVMEKLMSLKPDLRSERRSVCVMFLDIRNFTAFAEKRSPEEVVAYLESLFEFMIEIINRHQGVINKFLGDGFMAVFGAPLSDGSDCAHAVDAASEILRRVEEEVARGNVLPTKVGIGLHAGEAVTGSIGSSLRREYTVIGDVVNLAARIEKLNKQFDSRLLVSDHVWQTIGESPKAIPRGDVTVQGRQEAIQIFQIA